MSTKQDEVKESNRGRDQDAEGLISSKAPSGRGGWSMLLPSAFCLGASQVGTQHPGLAPMEFNSVPRVLSLHTLEGTTKEGNTGGEFDFHRA